MERSRVKAESELSSSASMILFKDGRYKFNGLELGSSKQNLSSTVRPIVRKTLFERLVP
jgi:hypothetical protein